MTRRILYLTTVALSFCIWRGVACAQLPEPLPKLNYEAIADFFQLLVPAYLLFLGSVVLFFRGRTVASSLLLGTGCLMVAVLIHIWEALHLFPWMHWGIEHSVGHYLDFWGAVLGLTLFPIGYLLYALTKRHA